MTPSKLTDAVERGAEKIKQKLYLIVVPDEEEETGIDDMLHTFASDLILAVRETVPEESRGAQYENDVAYMKGHNACRAEILHSLDAFLGDNEPASLT